MTQFSLDWTATVYLLRGSYFTEDMQQKLCQHWNFLNNISLKALHCRCLCIWLLLFQCETDILIGLQCKWYWIHCTSKQNRFQVLWTHKSSRQLILGDHKSLLPNQTYMYRASASSSGGKTSTCTCIFSVIFDLVSNHQDLAVEALSVSYVH